MPKGFNFLYRLIGTNLAKTLTRATSKAKKNYFRPQYRFVFRCFYRCCFMIISLAIDKKNNLKLRKYIETFSHQVYQLLENNFLYSLCVSKKCFLIWNHKTGCIITSLKRGYSKFSRPCLQVGNLFKRICYCLRNFNEYYSEPQNRRVTNFFLNYYNLLLENLSNLLAD